MSGCLIVTTLAAEFAAEIERLAGDSIPVKACASVEDAISAHTSESVLFGSPGLLMPAALLFLYFDPQRFGVLLNLTRLGKLLGLLSALLLIILEPLGTGLRDLSFSFLPYRIAPFSILLIVAVIDLIFLFLLFSFQFEVAETRAEPDKQALSSFPKNEDSTLNEPSK